MLIGPALLQYRRHVHAALVRERAHADERHVRIYGDVRHLTDETGQGGQALKPGHVRLRFHFQYQAGYH